MCEVNIYVKGKDGKESLVLADVYLIFLYLYEVHSWVLLYKFLMIIINR